MADTTSSLVIPEGDNFKDPVGLPQENENVALPAQPEAAEEYTAKAAEDEYTSGISETEDLAQINGNPSTKPEEQEGNPAGTAPRKHDAVDNPNRAERTPTESKPQKSASILSLSYIAGLLGIFLRGIVNPLRTARIAGELLRNEYNLAVQGGGAFIEKPSFAVILRMKLPLCHTSSAQIINRFQGCLQKKKQKLQARRTKLYHETLDMTDEIFHSLVPGKGKLPLKHSRKDSVIKRSISVHASLIHRTWIAVRDVRTINPAYQPVVRFVQCFQRSVESFVYKHARCLISLLSKVVPAEDKTVQEATNDLKK